MQERSPERKTVKAQLEVIAGSMFSGKSDELITRLTREEIAKLKVQAFKPAIDNRYDEGFISSHGGRRYPATLIDDNNPALILDLINPGVEVVGIDEAQFFSSQIVGVCETLADSGKRVIVAGLPTNFRGEGFGEMPNLMAKADVIDKVHAICMTCGEDADFTQRVVNGIPANYDEPLIVVGASESYEARCRKHHEVPGHPNIK